MKTKRVTTAILYALCSVQGALMLLSWIVSSLYPEYNTKSMLTGEFVRWFCGHLVEFCATPCLVWIVLLAMSAGTLCASGMLTGSSALHSLRKAPSALRRRAIVAASVTLALCLGAVACLTVVPHAILLSAVGELFPSPFSAAIVPMLAVTVCLVSAAYGVTCNRFQSLHDIIASFSDGIACASPLIVIYLSAAITVNCFLYVFSFS